MNSLTAFGVMKWSDSCNKIQLAKRSLSDFLCLGFYTSVSTWIESLLEETHLNIFHFHEPYFTCCPAIDDLIPETLIFIPCQCSLHPSFLSPWVNYLSILYLAGLQITKTCHVSNSRLCSSPCSTNCH